MRVLITGAAGFAGRAVLQTRVTAGRQAFLWGGILRVTARTIRQIFGPTPLPFPGGPANYRKP